MLRDLCPGNKREVFLLVSALREQIVPDLMSVQAGGSGGVPEEVVVSRSRRKLSDNLGFTEESAIWAVDSWLQASRILATTPDIPLPVYGPASYDETSVPEAPQSGLDWIWLVLCLSAVACSIAALSAVAWFSLHHDTSTFQAWLTETAIFTGSLVVPGIGLWFISRTFEKRRIPNHWIANPNLGAAAMLCEVAAILVLTFVPVTAIALWAGEWAQSWHITGQAHDLSFHLSRILQSLLFGLFLWQWILASIRIQGRLGGALTGRRR
jgi:hypothetical protein